MLFFKEVMEEKLKEPGFKRFFDQECHICPTTLKINSEFAEIGLVRDFILEELKISQKEFNDLYWAENCDPRVVMKLCRYLGLDFIGLSRSCPKVDLIDSSLLKAYDEKFPHWKKNKKIDL